MADVLRTGTEYLYGVLCGLSFLMHVLDRALASPEGGSQ